MDLSRDKDIFLLFKLCYKVNSLLLEGFSCSLVYLDVYVRWCLIVLLHSDYDLELYLC